MNNSSDKKGRKIASYIIPGIITLLVMVFVLIVKGIWPFGSNRIDLFDNMQQVAPLYAHLWDAMHGNASVWLNGLNIENADILILTLVPSPVYQSNHTLALPCIASHKCAYSGSKRRGRGR